MTTAWPPRFRPKVCSFCGEEFIPPSGVAKYCPDICQYAAHRLRVERWTTANPEKVQATKNKYIRSEKRKQYRRDHAEELLTSNREWRVRNHDRWRSYQNRYSRSRRASLRMGREDRQLSIAYRQAIQHNPCLYCGGPGEEDDHYFPVAKGGSDHWWNLVRSCLPCNRSKAAHCGTWFMLRMEA